MLLRSRTPGVPQLSPPLRRSREGRGERDRIGARIPGGFAAVGLVLVLATLALLLGGLAVRGGGAELRSAGAQREGRAGFYCAEAGLERARPFFAARAATWNAMLDPGLADPPGYPVTGDVDGDGRDDFEVTIRDNLDELPPLADDPRRDNDLQVVMVSRCTGARRAARSLAEIVASSGRVADYRHQFGFGSAHAGNLNTR